MSDVIDIDELKRAYPISDAVSHDTVYDAIEAAKNTPRLFKEKASVWKKDPKWSGSKSWEEMEEIVQRGWVKGRASVSASLEGIFQSNSASISSGRSFDYDVAGSLPVVPLAVAGEPEHMVSFGSEVDAKPVIRLAVNLGATCNVPGKAMMNRGAAVCALVDEIESAGNSCEIHAVWTTQNNGAYAAYSIGVKQAGEAVSIDDIAFCLGHTSMHRRVMFSMMERHKFAKDYGFDGGGCYGRSIEFDKYSWPNDCIHLSGINSDPEPYATPQSAMVKVRELYEAQAKAKHLEVEV